MAYYARKEGLAHYKFARTRQDRICFVCGNFIRKGDFRYYNRPFSLCINCADCWTQEGGRLGDISRNNAELKF